MAGGGGAFPLEGRAVGEGRVGVAICCGNVALLGKGCSRYVTMVERGDFAPNGAKAS